jgi:hypothetical protein
MDRDLKFPKRMVKIIKLGDLRPGELKILGFTGYKKQE